MRTLACIVMALVTLSAASPALARKITVEMTNLTNAIYYTPLLVVAHSRRYDLFEVGHPASEALQKMAEGGDIGDLAAEARAARSTVVENPAGGLLGPGQTTKVVLNAERHHRRLSIVAMLLPTNDGFVGLDSAWIPAHSGKRTFYLLGYDAGTEANDELITGGGAPGAPGIPADPGGLAGTNGTGAGGPDHNDRVHVHRNVVGDGDPFGGASDLDKAVHRWSNPVARVVVTVR